MKSQLVGALFSLVFVAAPLLAQNTSAAVQYRETRAGLQAEKAEAEQTLQRTTRKSDRLRLEEQIRRIDERLTEGDLRVGDQVTIEVVDLPEPTRTAMNNQSFTVKSGQMLGLPGIVEEIPLRGILRSELAAHVTTHLKKTFLNPQIRTTTVFGIHLTGQVLSPGSRTVRPDQTLSDVVTSAGTLTPLADLDKIKIRRNGRVIYRGEQTLDAITAGRTFDDLQLMRGDVIEVGMVNQTSFTGILQTVSGFLGIAIAVYAVIPRN